jgi:hypothetical protein
VTLADYPSGCYGGFGTVGFNAHPTGAPSANAKPLCAGKPPT